MQHQLRKLLSQLKKYSFDKILLFLTLLFLPTQLGRHFFFSFSYIYSLKIDYLSGIIYFWDILVLLLAAYWFKKGGRPDGMALTGILVFILSQIGSMFFSNIGPGLVRLEQYIVISLFGLYLSSLNISKIKKIILNSVMIGVLFESWLAFLQFVLGSSVGIWILGERNFSLSTPLIATFNWYGEVFLRPYGTFPHPNVLSAFLVICLPLLFFLYTEGGEKWSEKYSRLLGVTLASGFLAVIITFSRMALLVLGVESVLLLRRKLKVLLAVFLVALPFLFVRFDSAFNFDYLSISRREELAWNAISQFMSHPLFGVGLNNFISTTASSSLISGSDRFLQPVHNIFLLTLAEAGVVGFVGFLVLAGVAIKRLVKTRRFPTARVLMGLFGIILFLGMFDHYFLTLAAGQRLFFLIWGLSMQRNQD